MKRAISILATAATLTIGTAATAAEHIVLILPDAYFPPITYMSPGDTVRFINSSEVSRNIVAESAGWAIGPMEPDAEETLVIDAGVEMSFYDADMTDEEGNFNVQGEMSFAAAPLD